MLARIVAECGGCLPEGYTVLFANTGREMPETLDFVDAVSAHLGVPIVWLEYRCPDGGQHDYTVTSYAEASRSGQPFQQLIDKKRMLPNVVRRFCTEQLKIETMRRYLADQGVREYTNIIGLRADEPRRLAKMRARNATDSLRYTVAPMAEWGTSKWDVVEFWRRQSFDLALPSDGGVTPLGNCDMCFLKGAGRLSSIARDNPERSVWWVDQESKIASGPNKTSNARFIKGFRYEDLPGLVSDSLLPEPVECLGCTD